MVEPKKISKLDAARRQLDTALRLYFNELDFISIHTLACAAHEILRNMAKKIDITSMLEQIEAMTRPEKQKEVIKKLNEAKNFFKHANQDPESILCFRPEVSDYFIWDAVRLYHQLSGEHTALMKIFSTWFFIQNDGLLLEPEYKSLIKEIKLDYHSRADFFADAIIAVHKLR